MKESPFYFEIKDIMTQFIGAFNDIIIKRHNKDRSVRSRIHARYVYAPKQRVIHDIVNKARHITLPVVAVNINGISRDETRVFNKIEGAYFPNTERSSADMKKETSHMPQPVPINIEVSMSILARYQTDIEQIISNFVPHNDPYIVLSWKLPDNFTPVPQEIRSQVLWNGDLSINYPDEIGPTDPFRLACDTSFTIKTWLFKDNKQMSNIYKITVNTSPVSTIPDFSFSLPFYDDITERSWLESIGPPLTAAPYITHVDHENVTTGQDVEVLGYNFTSTTNVYLSSNNLNSKSGVHVTPFSESNLNTLYPAFSATPVEYRVVNDNKLKLIVPATMELQNDVCDIIIQNQGGYDTSLNSTLHGKGIFLAG